MALPLGDLVLPPAAPAQFAGFLPLALDFLLGDLDDEIFQGEPPRTTPALAGTPS
jgi:hypothetical protein